MIPYIALNIIYFYAVAHFPNNIWKADLIPVGISAYLGPPALIEFSGGLIIPAYKHSAFSQAKVYRHALLSVLGYLLIH